MNPKVWTKNFGVYFMRKKHDYSALLKYMHMLEDGYSINYICVKYGISHKRLLKLWILYQKEGATVLHRQAYTHSDAAFRNKVVLDIENNGISLVKASLKYNPRTKARRTRPALYAWTHKDGTLNLLLQCSTH